MHASGWLRYMRHMSSHAQSFADGRFKLRQRHFIDSHKGFNGLAILGFMAFYEAWGNVNAWLYLATHGLYGLMWVLKGRTFPDKQFDKPCGLAYGLVIWTALSLYWLSPFIICSQNIVPPPWYMGLCVAMFAAGVFFHFASDMQKHMHLRLASGTLLTGGLWAHCRNPNYFGELLIYAGFTALSMHWAPFLGLAAMLLSTWIPNMLRKDKSLSRYPEFARWKAGSGLFIPYLL